MYGTRALALVRGRGDACRECGHVVSMVARLESGPNELREVSADAGVSLRGQGKSWLHRRRRGAEGRHSGGSGVRA